MYVEFKPQADSQVSELRAAIARCDLPRTMNEVDKRLKAFGYTLIEYYPTAGEREYALLKHDKLTVNWINLDGTSGINYIPKNVTKNWFFEYFHYAAPRNIEGVVCKAVCEEYNRTVHLVGIEFFGYGFRWKGITKIPSFEAFGNSIKQVPNTVKALTLKEVERHLYSPDSLFDQLANYK